jgi:hypothetical protein
MTKFFFELKCNPSDVEVFQLIKHFSTVNNFVSHTMSIFLKNIGHVCGNTICKYVHLCLMYQYSTNYSEMQIV